MVQGEHVMYIYMPALVCVCLSFVKKSMFYSVYIVDLWQFAVASQPRALKAHGSLSVYDTCAYTHLHTDVVSVCMFVRVRIYL